MYKRQCQGTFRVNRPLILASASPRRRELLCSLGLEFRVTPSPNEEPRPFHGESHQAYAQRACGEKARAVSDLYPEAVTLAADTIVAVDDNILGKPADSEDALKMLSMLSGRSHMVFTACAVLWPEGGKSRIFLQETEVWIKKYPVEVLRAYVESGEPLDKAGSYAIQGMGAFLVERIEGSYTNVVGLPLDEVVAVLAEMGVLEVSGHQ